MNVTQVINWVCSTQANRTLPYSFIVADPQVQALCLNESGMLIRRDSATLMKLRMQYLTSGVDFPLDKVALIALNRLIAQPMSYAQVEDQLGRVLAVSYSPVSQRDPVLPVPLVNLGPRFDRTIYNLSRHLESYSDWMIDQRRWGKKARRLVEGIELALEEVRGYNILTARELAFIHYHAELSAAQPWRTR